jgi:radical SAM protein with 4Fe4S-binding SPASM domain
MVSWFDVYFEVRSKCNGSCAFCPGSVNKEKREDVLMPFDMYANVIGQLREMGYFGELNYHGTSEPLLFPQLEEFIEFAAQQLPEARRSILTNGILLTKERAQTLIAAGLSQIQVNLYRDKPAKVPEHILEIGAMCDAAKVAFTASIRDMTQVLNSRAGTSPNKKCIEPITEACDWPTRQFLVDGRGNVVKCCADGLNTDYMGNVIRESVMNIWNGEKYKHVRKLLAEGRRAELPGCRECDQTGVGYVNIGMMYSNYEIVVNGQIIKSEGDYKTRRLK